MDLFKYNLYLSEPKAIWFVASTFAVLGVISVYFLIGYILEKVNVKHEIVKKIINRKWTVYITFIAAIIFGLIFSSLKHFHNFYFNFDHQVLDQEQIWSWQSISFNFAIGSYMIAYVLLIFWILIPIFSYLSIKRIFFEKNSLVFSLKQLGWILTIIFSCIMAMLLFFVMKVNRFDTTLAPLEINKVLDDKFFYYSRYLYKYAFFTRWYSIAFICYMIGWLVISIIINYLEVKKNIKIIQGTKLGNLFLKKMNYTQIVLHKFPQAKFLPNTFFTPFIFLQWLASMEMFAFLTCFMLFNIKAPFTHLMFIIDIFISFIFMLIILMVVGLLKYRKQSLFYLNAYWLLIKQRFSFKKLEDIKLKRDEENTKRWVNLKLLENNESSMQMSQELIAGVNFTVFLGFTSFTVFHNYMQVGNSGWNHNLYDPYFWVSLILSSLFLNIMFIGIKSNVFMSKVAVGEGTYGVAPGLQSGWLNFLTGWINFSSKLIDNQIKLII